MSTREKFEKKFPVPNGVAFNDAMGRYEPDNPLLNPDAAQDAFLHHQRWVGWKAAASEGGSEQKDGAPHASLEVMGNIQIDEGGELQTYYKALVITFNSVEDIRTAIDLGRCTFAFKE